MEKAFIQSSQMESNYIPSLLFFVVLAVLSFALVLFHYCQSLRKISVLPEIDNES